ncbi:YdcF family protein [Eupransor demetentiae]|uniref:DUF218 family (ElyC) n=1 Tax=Eupransor demetentiae TaxID=3109584 RepID=A0ABM9N5G4_9LACO|nr:DUF218 family (ElyC) [Lactobacillaceae bacterium LMG 33000]
MTVFLLIFLGLSSALVLSLAYLSWGIWIRLRMRPMTLVLALFLLLVVLYSWLGLLWPLMGIFTAVWSGSLFVLFLLDLTWLLTLSAMAIYKLRHEKAPQADYIIVLGAYLRDGHRVGPVLAGRINAAMQTALAQESKPTVIFAGGQGFDESLPEGQAMRDYAGQHYEYPVNKLLAETKSRNTYQNLIYSQQMMQAPEQILIFTSDYHVLRAAFLAHRVGVKAQVYGGKTTLRVRWRGRLREYLAFLNLYQKTVIALIAGIYILSLLIDLI